MTKVILISVSKEAWINKKEGKMKKNGVIFVTMMLVLALVFVSPHLRSEG